MKYINLTNAQFELGLSVVNGGILLKVAIVQRINLIEKRGLVSEETVVLRRWGTETRNLGLSTELIM